MPKLRALPSLKSFKNLSQNTSGATTIEYVILAALMTLVLIAGLSSMAESNSGKWSKIANEVGEVHDR